MRVVHFLQNFWRSFLGALQTSPVARVALHERGVGTRVPLSGGGESKFVFESGAGRT
jgi:hypothetical protein